MSDFFPTARFPHLWISCTPRKLYVFFSLVQLHNLFLPCHLTSIESMLFCCQNFVFVFFFTRLKKLYGNGLFISIPILVKFCNTISYANWFCFLIRFFCYFSTRLRELYGSSWLPCYEFCLFYTISYVNLFSTRYSTPPFCLFFQYLRLINSKFFFKLYMHFIPFGY